MYDVIVGVVMCPPAHLPLPSQSVPSLSEYSRDSSVNRGQRSNKHVRFKGHLKSIAEVSNFNLEFPVGIT